MKKILTALLAVSAATAVSAQQTAPPAIQNPTLSGYIQVQNQWGEPEAPLKVGTPNETPSESFNRLGIRRGRVKFAWQTGPAVGVLQFDLTEKGVGVKEAYLSLRDPWIGTMSFTAGVFNRPFGYEIAYSSSQRESPERSTVFQTLFPNERDLGAMLTLQAPETSPLRLFKLEAGLFAGGGIAPENDDRRDFIGHLSLAGEGERIGFGAGVSYYNGQAFVATESAYRRREYFGVDGRLSFRRSAWQTKLTAEYLAGEQPGMGDFTGGYVLLVQYLGRVPVALVGKYDRFAPDEAVDRQTVGAGALWNLTPAVRLTAWYDFNRNGGTEIEDDVFTLRLQYKF